MRLRKLGSAIAISIVLGLASLAAVAQQAETDAPNGALIFAQRCAKCHGASGEGISAVAGIAGPNIQAEHNQGYVMMAVATGPGHMPTFSRILTGLEIQAVARYVAEQIATIPLQGGDLQKGGEHFRSYCASCHRTAVQGGALVYTDVNAPELTGMSAARIAGAIRSGPGPMPKFPPGVLNDQDLASVVKYVRFAENPPSPGGNALSWYGPVPEGYAAWVAVLLLVAVTIWIERGRRG